MAARSDSKDKLLFTPGPITTSRTVKQAMLRDIGSRDSEFIELVKEVRRKLLELGGVSGKGYQAIVMQGSGTFSLEAVVSSTVPEGGKVLVISNGAYGRRLAQIARNLRIEVATLDFAEDARIDPAGVESTLAADPTISNVGMVHCETSTGMINPIQPVGKVIGRSQARFFVDAMSSFGAVPLDVGEYEIDYLVSSANKCIEGVPGFGIVLARQEALLESEDSARSLSLDLLDQWKGLEADGQFRFTPPTHALLAFHQALQELETEGGVRGRGKRYRANYEALVNGMRSMGFREYLKPKHQGYIITSFRYPDHPNFEFERFYTLLSEKGFVIYPGKVSEADCFRIGSIGRIFPEDVRGLLNAIRDTMTEMDFQLDGSLR